MFLIPEALNMDKFILPLVYVPLPPLPNMIPVRRATRLSHGGLF